MIQFKRAKVIMLPTEKPTTIFLSEDKLFISTTPKPTISIGFGQHLYIISDDEIKEDDIGKYTIYENNHIELFKNWNNQCLDGRKVIIATTDTSIACIKDILSIVQRKGLTNYYPTEKWILPQPSEQFITKYIELYNKGNKIEDVLVEYENKYDLEYYTPPGGIESCRKIDNWKLKVNPKDNTINIQLPKDSWNREEIIKLLKSFEKEIEESMDSDDDYNVFTNIDSNKWIEENL